MDTFLSFSLSLALSISCVMGLLILARCGDDEIKSGLKVWRLREEEEMACRGRGITARCYF